MYYIIICINILIDKIIFVDLYISEGQKFDLIRLIFFLIFKCRVIQTIEYTLNYYTNHFNMHSIFCMPIEIKSVTYVNHSIINNKTAKL